MPNFERMDATLKFMKGRNALHQQSRWMVGNAVDLSGTELLDTTDDICGTTGCFAGWGSLASGFHQLRRGAYTTASGKVIDLGSELVVDENGDIYDMKDAAVEAFDLNEQQAHCLFNSGNSLEEIEQMIDWLRDNPDDYPDHIGAPARLIEDGMGIDMY